jgi:hypothetical protein
VVDGDTALGQQLLHIAVGQAVAQIPAHRQHDHLGGKPDPSERRPMRHERTRTRGTLHRSRVPRHRRSPNATEPATFPCPFPERVLAGAAACWNTEPGSGRVDNDGVSSVATTGITVATSDRGEPRSIDGIEGARHAVG